MISNDLSIGVFDSGVGGLTVVKEIIKTLPNENLIYLGDTARVPYGTRDNFTISKFAKELTQVLIHNKVKAMVVACNTMSAVALSEIIKIAGEIPVIDVISPTVKFAISLKGIDILGVIGTRATINSRAYEARVMKLDDSIRMVSIACPLFVPLVEEGFIENDATKIIVKDYLTGFKNENIDALILGCTHYPVLSKIIKEIMGPKIELINSGIPTALALKDVLVENNLLRISESRPKLKFYVTDSPERAREIANLLFENKFPGVIEKIKI